MLARRYRDFDAAEDAVQEALLAAATQWPREGRPDNPRGWLITVGSRRLVDQLRSEQARRRREELAAGLEPVDRQWAAPADQGITEGPEGAPAGPGSPGSADGRYGDYSDYSSDDGDDTLVVLFMCCHPALPPSSAVALTLRSVGGLTTAEIARAFLVPEATMAQRISRAKQRIKASGVPFELPGPADRAARLASALQVLYLVFTEGSTSSSGRQLQRVELAREAIRLTRAVHRLLPDDSEVTGLLALMLLTDARSRARTGPDGELVPLAEQDRSRWDASAIAEGVALVTAALPRGPVGPYQVQAAVAALHDEAATFADTDWPQILALYGVLEQLTPTPVVALNRAVAVAMVHGPAAGLELLTALEADGRLAGQHHLPAAKAHLLELAGNPASAVAYYRAAANRTASLPERHYLTLRAARLDHPADEI